MTLVLYTTPLSANGRKVLAVSRELGLRPEIRTVDVYRGEGRAPEYLALNPAGKIPTLRDGDFLLTESNAICVYLSEAHGEGRLFSSDPRERARIASWLFWEAAHWQPALSAVLAPAVGHALRPDAVPAPVRPPDWSDAQLAPCLRRLEEHLEKTPWLAGEALSLADFVVAGMTTYFRAADFPFEDHPALRAWTDRLDALESWRATLDPLWQ